MAGKRRGNREGCITQRKDGRWEGRYTLPNGSRRCVYGATREDAARKLAEALLDIDRGVYATDAALTVDKFLGQWLVDIAPTVRARTHQGYTQHVHDHLAPAIGRVKVTRLTPAHVRQLLRDLSNKGLSAATIGRVRATLRAALAQAERDGTVTRNVAKLVTQPKVERHELRAITVEDVRAIMVAVEGDRLGRLVVVALTTALRQGELLGLMWADVDLDARTLTVKQALQRLGGKAVIVPPKSATSRRMVELPDVAVAALRKQRSIQRRERLVASRRWVESGLVFTTTTGTPMDGPTVTKRFHQLLEAAGLPQMRFHDLRHGCASIMVALGLPIKGVADMLGHSDPSLTLRTYTHIPREVMRDAADRLDRAITGDGGA